MRLVCPNCDAEYEVDGAAIPRAGRDVQCSNCGHAWFQAHPDVLAERDEEEALFGAPQDIDDSAPPGPVAETGQEILTKPGRRAAVAEDVPAAKPIAEPVIASMAGPEIAALPLAGAPQTPPPATRNIDESVLAVLREEAEREAAVRRAEATPSPLETQTEMPLEPGGAAGRRIARLKEASVVVPEPARDLVVEPETATRPRRDLFPAIEEVNSTLRATSDRAGDDEAADMAAMEATKAERAGFGRGFLTLVLIGVILLALYVFAPLIAARVPALADTAQAYVAAVDAARLWLDGQIRALVGWLRGLEGATQG